MGRQRKEFDIDKYRSDLKTDTKGHYVPNAILLAEIKRCHELGELTEDAARMFMTIARHVAKRYHYKTQEDKDDCVNSAVLDCCRYWRSFDIEKGDNPFAYFTTMCTNGLGKCWDQLGYKDIPFSRRVSLSDNIYSI